MWYLLATVDARSLGSGHAKVYLWRLLSRATELCCTAPSLKVSNALTMASICTMSFFLPLVYIINSAEKDIYPYAYTYAYVVTIK